MKKMQGYLDALDAELERNSAGLIDLQNILGEGDAYAITSRLEGTLSRIQGEILEQEVQRFLVNKIPHQVVVTGSVTSADGGKIKPDLVVALDNLELKNQDGQTTYRFRNGDIYNTENVKQTENISLTSYEIKSLNAGTIGFSAKTTSGRPTFHQGYNINQLIEDSIEKGDPTSALYQLMHFYQLGLQNVPNITTYQRYAVARLAIQIMGQNNAFIITKNEIIPTWQYMEKLMHRGGLYFANNKIPARANTDVLNSKFGSTNIVGQTV